MELVSKHAKFSRYLCNILTSLTMLDIFLTIFNTISGNILQFASSQLR